MLALEIAVIVLIVLINGFLAMSELAVVSARRSRLTALAEGGDRRASRVIQLADRPGRFLSTVQIGITMCGVLAGVFSGATIADRLAVLLTDAGVSPGVAEPLSFALIVIAVTYLSLILGELVPKQIALRGAERIAMLVAGPMLAVSRVTAPLGYLLERSSHYVLLAIGVREERGTRVTDEEIKALIAEAETAGVVEPAERSMISGVLRLGDRPVRAVMTPRLDVDWIDLDMDEADIRETIRRSGHSRLVAARGTLDEPAGVLHVKDVLDALLIGQKLDIGSLVRRAPVIHDRFDALEAVEHLKQPGVQMVLVVDEHGAFEGVITRADILSSIAGDFQEADGYAPERAVRRGDGSWLFDGLTPIDEVAGVIGVPVPAARDYRTVAGFVLDNLQHLPSTGEYVDTLGWRFEVVDMDSRRIDKVLVTKSPNGARG